jgi:acyl dehydratase
VALNLSTVGKRIGPLTLKYDWKDVVLYSLGVGAGFSEIDYCCEKALKVIPTFAAATLGDFTSQLAAVSGFNPAGVLHGEQEFIFHRPIPLEGELITEGVITHYYDKGKAKGALVVARFDTRLSDGRTLFTSVVRMFARLDGGFGGSDAPKQPLPFLDRAPDAEVSALPMMDQPLIYRLSGDTFPLHVDAEFARKAGFERPVMHGLCTLGYACRALILCLSPGSPERVRRIGCRFTSPLYPGTPIRTLVWVSGEGRALWRVVRASDGGVVIDKGIFEFGDPPHD